MIDLDDNQLESARFSATQTVNSKDGKAAEKVEASPLVAARIRRSSGSFTKRSCSAKIWWRGIVANVMHGTKVDLHLERLVRKYCDHNATCRRSRRRCCSRPSVQEDRSSLITHRFKLKSWMHETFDTQPAGTLKGDHRSLASSRCPTRRERQEFAPPAVTNIPRGVARSGASAQHWENSYAQQPAGRSGLIDCQTLVWSVSA